MGRPKDKDLFIRGLVDCGGRASNASLQSKLGWTDNRYWKVHSALYGQGAIEKGRGYSGTVILVPAKPEEAPSVKASVEADELAVQSPVQAEAAETDLQEADLYRPARAQIAEHWHTTRNLDQTHVENIALQGRRETGGSWSRPDLALVALKTFEYLPDRIFEIHTFEIKPSYDVTVKGVLEALAHREFATRSYVIYHTAGRELTDYPEYSRIEALAVRYGIGVYAAKVIGDFNKWAEIVSAERARPDPEEVEVFIKRSLSEDTKVRIRKWLK